ncbi:hypothetical protein FOZ63_005790 [Perkinsus olseni]|uniref:Uncharacterized protein n=1 Tax=Perkinsus olseni TaxID=32597 RepID=A0A7J6PQS8_PEROL|nr:hypothetical protein FOZ63_005790 [Perkinsus olseni]
MLTKQHTIILVSATAVAFLSNLPLGNAALGTIASHDGYPLLSNMTLYESDYGRAQCFYGDYYGEPGSSFHLRILKNGIRTGMVQCPETHHWAAFDVEELTWADGHTMSSLAAVAGRIRSHGNGALVFVNNAMTDGNEDMLLASEILEGICNAAVEALRREYPSYEDLCAEYHGIAEAAVAAVGDDGWVVEEGKKVYRPK